MIEKRDRRDGETMVMVVDGRGGGGGDV